MAGAQNPDAMAPAARLMTIVQWDKFHNEPSALGVNSVVTVPETINGKSSRFRVVSRDELGTDQQDYKNEHDARQMYGPTSAQSDVAIELESQYQHGHGANKWLNCADFKNRLEAETAAGSAAEYLAQELP